MRGQCTSWAHRQTYLVDVFRQRRSLLRPDLQDRPDPALWQDVYAQVVRALAPAAPQVVMDALSDVPERLTGELFACRDALFARSQRSPGAVPYIALPLDARDPETLELVARFASWSRSLDMSGRGLSELWVRSREPWLQVWVPSSSTIDVDIPLPDGHSWIRKTA